MIATILLGECPGLFFSDIGIGFIGQFHNLANGAAKLTRFKVGGNIVTGSDKAGNHLRFGTVLREGAAPKFFDKTGTAAGNVHDLTDEI